MTIMNTDLKGKRAVVTGASLGIGAAIVRMLADHGAQVEFAARNQQAVQALAKESSSITGHAVDLSQADSTQTFLDTVMAKGPVDILVNNLGAAPSRNFLYMTDEEWLQLHELNLMSAVRCSRALIPAMRKQNWGRIVMISSVSGFYPNPALIDYGTSKAAMISLAKSLATKYGPDNVLVNSVLPGLIRTDMWEKAAGEIASRNNLDKEAVFEHNSAGVPQRRYGTADEIAGMVTFLCSEAASYCNGACFTVDGGSSGHI